MSYAVRLFINARRTPERRLGRIMTVRRFHRECDVSCERERFRGPIHHAVTATRSCVTRVLVQVGVACGLQQSDVLHPGIVRCLKASNKTLLTENAPAERTARIPFPNYVGHSEICGILSSSARNGGGDAPNEENLPYCFLASNMMV